MEIFELLLEFADVLVARVMEMLRIKDEHLDDINDDPDQIEGKLKRSEEACSDFLPKMYILFNIFLPFK